MGAEAGGSGGGGAAAKQRAKVESFLAAAAARLNALVAEQEDALFRDRGKPESVKDKGCGEEGDKGAGADVGAAKTAAALPNMSDEELYQVMHVPCLF